MPDADNPKSWPDLSEYERMISEQDQHNFYWLGYRDALILARIVLTQNEKK